VEQLKVTLVTKGYAQTHGVDYNDTFFPVVKFSSVRAPIAFAVQNDMLPLQMDAVTTFLKGNLEEEIFMMDM